MIGIVSTFLFAILISMWYNDRQWDSGHLLWEGTAGRRDNGTVRPVLSFIEGHTETHQGNRGPRQVGAGTRCGDGQQEDMGHHRWEEVWAWDSRSW